MVLWIKINGAYSVHLFHHYHHRRKHRTLDSNFWLFEFSVWLHVFGYSLIAIFIPILLLELNYTIGEVMIYYFLYNAFDVPLNFWAQWLTKRVGARMVIAFGTLAVILFFGILFKLGPHDWLLLTVLAFVAAIYDVCYWVGHLYFFMQSSKKRKSASKDTSFLNIARELGGLLAPAFGALILIFFNKKLLIILSIVILTLSIIPLIKIKNVEDKPKKNPLPFKTFFRSWSDIKNYLISSLYSVHSAAEWVIWPIFLYLLFDSIESVAIIPIIISITTIIFTYFAGNIKKEHRSIAIMLGGTLIALTWILRLLIQEPLYYYVSIFLIGLFTIFITIPVDSTLFERGEKIDPLTASTYCNFFPMTAKMIFFGFLALLINVFHVSFLTAAGSMFLVVVVMLLIKEKGGNLKTK